MQANTFTNRSPALFFMRKVNRLARLQKSNQVHFSEFQICNKEQKNGAQNLFPSSRYSLLSFSIVMYLAKRNFPYNKCTVTWIF